MKRLLLSTAIALAIASTGAHATNTQIEPQQALEKLNSQTGQFRQRVVQTADNVFTAVGYHGANTSMIVGDDGVIIVDTLMGPESASNALKAFRKYSGKPVKAIIYTHSHPDHVGGASAFVGEEQPEIIVMDNFLDGHGHGTNKDINPIMARRGSRQFGRNLPQELETHRGVAPAKTLDHDRGKGHLPATIRIKGDSYKTTIAGIELELYASPGETDDALFVWLPNEKVLFSGDNFYHAFPNLYAVRGTPYRDVRNWSNSVGLMATFEPHYLVPGHTMPLKGQIKATQALQDYSDAIRSVYQQTIAGINQGKGPDQLAHEVKLPSELAYKPYLMEFYGNVPNAVRAIYAGLLGWFDGNPTNLNPLAPKQQAEQMAKLAGGSKNLVANMQQAAEQGEWQWAMVLADQVRWLDDGHRAQAKEVKIKALRALAAMEYNAPNRNYYFSYAEELASGQLDEVWN